MRVVPACAFSDHLFVANGILNSIELNLEMSRVVTKHFVLALSLKLNEVVHLTVVLLFGQPYSQVCAIVFRVKIQAALARNFLTETVHFVWAVWNVVSVVWKLDDEWLIGTFVTSGVEDFEVDLRMGVGSDFAVGSKNTVFVSLAFD